MKMNKKHILLFIIFLSLLSCHPNCGIIATIHGDCSRGREIGNLKRYSIRLRAENNDLGYIHIRANAACFEEGRKANILGTVPCGTILYGYGPLKNADYSAGIAYAVAVQDENGNKCKGYVSFTVIEFLDKSHFMQ
jgi:hypothetical protein